MVKSASASMVSVDAEGFSTPNRTVPHPVPGPHAGAYTKHLYELPKSVVSLSEVYCRGDYARRRGTSVTERPPERTTPSRVLHAIRRIHLEVNPYSYYRTSDIRHDDDRTTKVTEVWPAVTARSCIHSPV